LPQTKKIPYTSSDGEEEADPAFAAVEPTGITALAAVEPTGNTAFAAVEPTGIPAFEAVEPTGRADTAEKNINKWNCENEKGPINEKIAIPICLSESIICAPFASTDRTAATNATFICESIPSTDHKGKNNTDVPTSVCPTGADETGTDTEHFMTRFFRAPADNTVAVERVGRPDGVATNGSTVQDTNRTMTCENDSWTALLTRSMSILGGGYGSKCFSGNIDSNLSLLNSTDLLNQSFESYHTPPSSPCGGVSDEVPEVFVTPPPSPGTSILSAPSTSTLRPRLSDVFTAQVSDAPSVRMPSQALGGRLRLD
jgi:hypothetical protein